MAAPPYQKFFWGSYHKHTSHLSHGREHGAYLLLIGALWNNGGRLPADDETLAAFAKLSDKEWAAVKPKIMPLFKIVRGKLTQARVTEDLAKYASTSGKRKVAGKAGGEASAGKQKGNRTAIATRLPTKPEPEPEDKPPKPPEGAFDQIFDQAWDAYPDTTTSSRDRSFAAWRFVTAPPEGPGVEPDRLLSAVRAYAAHQTQAGARAKSPPAFHVWLRGGRYDSFLASDVATITAWSGPPEIWEALAAPPRTAAYANSWLRSCTWQEVPVKAVVSASVTTLKRLRAEERFVWALDQMGVQILERAA